MKESEMYTEDDLRLVHALQVSPRASWEALGSVTGQDPATVARRWRRLSETGAAWLSVHPGAGRAAPATGSFIEVDCASDQITAAAQALARDPRIMTVEHMTGGRSLVLTVVTDGLPRLSDLLVNTVAAAPGVLATRSQLISRIFADGSRWRLGSLEAADQHRLEPTRSGEGSGMTPARSVPPTELRRLLLALSPDPRITISALAERLSVSRPTARRSLQTALDRGQLILRCDLPHGATGWPVSATVWCEAPPDQMAEISRGLIRLPEVRLVAGLTGGRANLLVSLWLRDLLDLHDLESRIAERAPRLQIIDRAVALRHVKRVGMLLGPHGRAVERVPVDVWYGQD